ncbi:MAG: hypothetical protein N2512_10025 [Armatimonadetes bacterium]|nr:hypothetical protein [Armatimonadota bacterium]
MLAYTLFLVAGMSCLGAALSAKAPEGRDPPTLGLHILLDFGKSPLVVSLFDLGRGLGYEAVVLELGGNMALKAQVDAPADWSIAEIRRLVAEARRRGLEVIPSTSLLSHPECAPRNPQYIDRAMGWRLWEPGAYEYMARVVEEICELFGRPRYFHARLDEAVDAVAANSAKLGVTPADFLAAHIRRVRDICCRNGAQLIIWHDMLISREHVPFANSLGGLPLNCWQAVEEIPRDVIINFWLYDFEPQHAAGPEFFLRRGFEVWLSPWLCPAPMSRWAAERNLPVLETTWIDPSAYPFTQWLVRGIVAAADWRLRGGKPASGQPADPLLRAARLLVPTPSRIPALQPLSLPPVPSDDAAAVETGQTEHLGRLLPKAVTLGQTSIPVQRPALLYQPAPTLDDNLRDAKPPLRVIRADGTSREINGVNRPRGQGELILYSPAHGPRTGTNIYGPEQVAVGNILQDIAPDTYGVGDSYIPPGGFVLSAHCGDDLAGPRFLSGMGRFQPVRIVDADGRDLLAATEEASPAPPGLRIEIPAGRPVREIWLVHATLRALPVLAGAGDKLYHLPVVGHLAVEAPGFQETFEVRWGEHVACWRLPRCLVDESGRPARDAWLAWGTDDHDGSAMCLWATRLRLTKPAGLTQLRLDPTPAGWRAGWLIAAAALVR